MKSQRHQQWFNLNVTSDDSNSIEITNYVTKEVLHVTGKRHIYALASMLAKAVTDMPDDDAEKEDEE